ncbi:MAG TPA: hypothetical protein EYO73_06990 [Sulfurimonas sp.]|nr:hypothetical protein [Sulfurimonas sp.]
MKLFILAISLLLLSGCSFKSQEELAKRVKVNSLICPEGFSTPKHVHKNLTYCNYYDEKKAAEASKSPLKSACKNCLEDKGYKLE